MRTCSAIQASAAGTATGRNNAHPVLAACHHSLTFLCKPVVMGAVLRMTQFTFVPPVESDAY